MQPTAAEIQEAIKASGGQDKGASISWHWVTDIPFEDLAIDLDRWLRANNLETRGVYPSDGVGWAVRWRR